MMVKAVGSSATPSPEEAKENAPSSPFSAFHPYQYDELQFTSVLGNGRFGIVYHALYQDKPVAVKQPKTTCLPHDFQKEIEILSTIASPYIVKFFGTIQSPHDGIVMEYMPGQSLFDLLNRQGGTLNWQRQYHIPRDIACALKYCHDNRIIHRDLKTKNILLDSNMRAKLCDFGLATNDPYGDKHVGTPYNMAPETWDRCHYSAKTDIYNFGMTLWTMTAGKNPYQGMTKKEEVRKWVSAGHREVITSSFPPKIAKLIKWCWSQNPKDRPTADQVIAYLDQNEEAVTSPKQGGCVIC
jgi:serine/threonine protein kinase